MRQHFLATIGLTVSTFWPVASLGGPITVAADGTGDFPTIQDAISAAPDGSVIELLDGVFRGPGNRDLMTEGKNLTFRSRSGDPQACILDAEGSSSDPHRGFLIFDSPALIVMQGLTIRGGHASSLGQGSGHGGAVLCLESDLILENCHLLGNDAILGGALVLEIGNGEIRDCLFAGNRASSGGALAAGISQVSIAGSTIASNQATGSGGGILAGFFADVAVVETAVWGNCAPNGRDASVDVEGSLSMSCSLTDDQGIAGTATLQETVFADPQFCDPASCDSSPTANGEYTISDRSPCLPSTSPCGTLIGAFGVGCTGPTPTLTTRWGQLKEQFLELLPQSESPPAEIAIAQPSESDPRLTSRGTTLARARRTPSAVTTRNSQ